MAVQEKRLPSLLIFLRVQIQWCGPAFLPGQNENFWAGLGRQG